MSIRTKPCYVYVIGRQAGANVCKVGISDNPEKRLRSLQSGSPHRLYIQDTLRLDSRADAIAVEAKAHEMMSPARMSGEWFSVAPASGFLLARVASQFVKRPFCVTKQRLLQMAFAKVERQA